MLGQRLEFRQGQSLVITPQLQQAIKLLQLSNLEIEAYVEAELERNPLLQRDESETTTQGEAPAPETDSRELEFTAEDSGAAREAVDAREDDLYGDSSPADQAADAAAVGADTGSDVGGGIDWSRAGKGGSSEADGDIFERLSSREKTLTEHLTEQASMAGFSTADHAIAISLIDGVDEGGYLRVSCEETAERMGCEVERVEAVLARCQGFLTCVKHGEHKEPDAANERHEVDEQPPARATCVVHAAHAHGDRRKQAGQAIDPDQRGTSGRFGATAKQVDAEIKKYFEGATPIVRASATKLSQ